MNYLPINYKLKNKYKIKKVIAESDFSNVYLTFNKEKRYVIKECFPSQLVIRGANQEVFTKKYEDRLKEVKESFDREVEILAHLHNVLDSNSKSRIIELFDYFEENKTVYIVEEYFNFPTLKQYILNEENIKGEDIKKIYFDILDIFIKIHNEKITISSNVQLLNYLEYSLLKRDIEVFKVLFLNTQNELLKEEELFKGTLDRSTVYIRELVKKILDYNAKSVIIVHNHPSGSLKPSQSDITLTQKLKDTFERIEIRLLDHLIISEKGYFSFLEGGLL